MTIDHKPKKYIQGYICTVHKRHASLGKAGIWAHRSLWEEALSLDCVKEKESKKKTGTYSSGTVTSIHQQLDKFSEMSKSIWKCLKCLKSDDSDKYVK